MGGLNDANAPVFQVDRLNIVFDTPQGEVHAVKDISFTIQPGECYGIVGESGSGKTQLFLAALGLLARNGRARGIARYRGRDLLKLDDRSLGQVRGRRIAVVFQDALNSLTPHLTIGEQMREVIDLHLKLSRAEAHKRAVDALDLVRIPEAARRLRQYPHELSGGMRQRVMIAIAMLCEPDLLIADEPTTALDVTVQAQILEIFRDLRRSMGTTLAFISHDMGVVAGLCDRIQVMRGGRIIEVGRVDEIFYRPQDAYTRRLLAAAPRLDQPAGAIAPAGQVGQAPAGDAGPVLEMKNVAVHFPVASGSGLFGRARMLRAVDDISLTVQAGEAVGIVGESGSGKSTLALAAVKLAGLRSGAVAWLGSDVTDLKGRALRTRRSDLQAVFQDPLASLDPRMTIGESIAEPLTVFRSHYSSSRLRSEVIALADAVGLGGGLGGGLLTRYPHELSGGQNQRAAIARAMVLKPALVVCDEVTSALDVSVQHQLIALLRTLQAQHNTALLFISHDLAVVRQLCHRVAVVHMGRIVELAPSAALFENPRHPYTKSLLAAVPVPDPEIQRSRPRVPLHEPPASPLDSRAQLQFLKSKMIDDPDARQYQPRLVAVQPGHLVAEFDDAGPPEGGAS